MTKPPPTTMRFEFLTGAIRDAMLPFRVRDALLMLGIRPDIADGILAERPDLARYEPPTTARDALHVLHINPDCIDDILAKHPDLTVEDVAEQYAIAKHRMSQGYALHPVALVIEALQRGKRLTLAARPAVTQGTESAPASLLAGAHG